MTDRETLQTVARWPALHLSCAELRMINAALAQRMSTHADPEAAHTRDRICLELERRAAQHELDRSYSELERRWRS